LLGQAIKAVVVSDRTDVTEADMLRHCWGHPEAFMILRYGKFRFEMPKTTSGDINTAELR
jgi:hypothetical protein